MTFSRTVSLAAATLLLVSSSLGGQSAEAMAMATSRTATRAELTAAADELDRFLQSTAYSEPLLRRVRDRAGAARRRLADGDFQVGDRIALRIEGQLNLDDTLTVLTGRHVIIRGFRQVSVAGLLRSELEPLLRADLADFVRTATISARPLTRMAIYGAVLRPGFVSLPAEATLDQAISLAGGPTATADPSEAKLMRADTTLLSRKEVALAVARGSTVGDLGIQDGDALVVPPQDLPWDRNATLQIVGLLLTPLLTIFVIQRR